MSDTPPRPRMRKASKKNAQKTGLLDRLCRCLRHRATRTELESSGSSVPSIAAPSDPGDLHSRSIHLAPPSTEASTAADPRITVSTPESPGRSLSEARTPPSSSTNNSNIPSPITLPSIASATAVTPCANTVVPRELWSEALAKLSAEEQKAIQGLQSASGTRLSLSENRTNELLDLAKSVQKKCEENSSKFEFRGKELIVRDIAGKIIFWLSKFKEVGDIAVNVDPVHAGLPWAGVRFLLQVAISEHEQMEILVVAAEKLSYLINRGAIYQRLYRPGTIPADVVSNLYDTMVKMYVTVLRTLALCHRLLDKNFVKRALHAIFNRDVSERLQECEKLEVQVEREAQNCERTRSQKADTETKELLDILREPMLRTDARVFDLLEQTQENECLGILDWISKVLYGSNHQTVKDKRTMNTCEWLLNHNRYQEWQDASASVILWLRGNTGTGKTFLTSKVIDTIQGVLETKRNQEGFAFFYCNRNEAERRDPLSVLRAFVRQLSTIAHDRQHSSIQKSLKQFVIDARLKAAQPTITDCKKLLLDFINTYPRTTLVLDALDECEGRNGLDLIEVFNELLAKASNPLKIFISSRPDPDIKENLDDRINIEINAKDNHDDITTFVNSQISKHPKWHKMDSQLQTQITTTLQERSNGMFQWAFLQIQQLLELKLRQHILAHLGKLPKDLEQAYDEIYSSITEDEKDYTDRAFKWVMCAHRPLDTKTLLAAISQDERTGILNPLLDDLDEDAVLKYCRNLLVIDPVRKVWIPSHLSVIEYFEKKLWSQTVANSLVLNVCLLVLQNTIFFNREEIWGNKRQLKRYASEDDLLSDDSLSRQGEELKDPMSGPPFAYLSIYARHHWPIHAQRTADSGNNNRTSTRLEEFLGLPTNSSLAYRCWLRMVTSDSYHKPSTSVFSRYIKAKDIAPNSIASFSYCVFGLDSILPEWHDFKWVKDDNRTQEGHSFLELVALSGSLTTCQNLIDHGSDVNAQSQSVYGGYGSVLAAAAWAGEKEIVKFLVREGEAQVNMQLQHGTYGSALAAAAWAGEKGIVKFLVREGEAQVNMQLQYGNYGSALAAAAWTGQKEIVKFLVREGEAQVNMQLQYGTYGSALAAAAWAGEKGIVKFLVREGADVNMQVHGEFGSALAAALVSGEREIVEFLVRKGGVDVNMQLQYGLYGSALVAAIHKGEKEMVKFLVKEGEADLNMQVQHGEYGSALATAACKGQEEMVKFLVIKGGADVNMQLQYGHYGSALAAAISKDEEEIVEFLVIEGEANVNMQLQYGHYGSALAVATSKGDDEIVDFLVKKGGADVNLQLQHGDFASALDAAQEEQMKKLLIEYGTKKESHGGLWRRAVVTRRVVVTRNRKLMRKKGARKKTKGKTWKSRQLQVKRN
ncbi:hypothetical protein EG329_014314 [Mollisiaceae sp. DMI_Dod_QoI]|nr:hypothetical protein EG329_014314 [Helotiales sp. DMI_Dod_QoI]